MEWSTVGMLLLLIYAIVECIDVPTTRWLFRWNRRSTMKRRTLLEILGDPRAIRETQGTTQGKNETKAQAKTYAEAIKGMQEREKARLHPRASGGDKA